MDPQQEIEELKARVARLEQMAGLAVAPVPAKPVEPTPLLAPAPSAAAATPLTPPPLPTTAPSPAPASIATPQRGAVSSEAWLARIGIGLLLIGILLFLKLSLDRGWITPLLQLVAASGVCLFLLIWGDRVSRHRPAIGNLAFGAGIAGLIGVAAAGQYIYHLYDGGISTAFTLVAALICFTQALRRDSAALCVLALLGTTISPFFLGLADISLFATDALVAAGLALATFLFRGWRSVLWVGAVTCWLLLFSAVTADWFTPVTQNRAVTQTAVIIAWLGFWLVPIGRLAWKGRAATDSASLWLTAFLPGVAAMLATGLLWGENSRGTVGGALLVLAALSLAMSLATKKYELLPTTQLVAAAIFGGLAIPILLQGLSCWMVLAVYSFALHLAARGREERPLKALAYLVTLILYGAFLVLTFFIADSGVQNWSETISCLSLLAAIAGAACLSQNPNLGSTLKVASCLGAAIVIGAEVAGGQLSPSWGLFLSAIVALASWLGVLGGKSDAQNVFAHVLFLVLAPLLLIQLFDDESPVPWMNPMALSTLGVLATALTLSLTSKDARVRLIYLWVIHVLSLILLWSQFRHVGQGIGVSVSWAIFAVVLITVGMIRYSRALRLAGMSTLVLLLIRLFTVDLASLDLMAKTVIFIGIGLFLFVAGYFLPKLLPENPKKAP